MQAPGRHSKSRPSLDIARKRRDPLPASKSFRFRSVLLQAPDLMSFMARHAFPLLLLALSIGVAACMVDIVEILERYRKMIVSAWSFDAAVVCTGKAVRV